MDLALACLHARASDVLQTDWSDWEVALVARRARSQRI